MVRPRIKMIIASKLKRMRYGSSLSMRDSRNKLYMMLEYKYPNRVNSIVDRFENYTGLPFGWNNISVFTLNQFRDGCLRDMTQNSAATTCSRLASAIRMFCSDKQKNPDQLCAALVVRRVEGEFAYVNEQEMEKVIEFYQNEKPGILKNVAAMAIVEYYTAARLSDSKEFDATNIDDRAYVDRITSEIKTMSMISYVSQKTSVKASIPVKPIVHEIINNTDVNIGSMYSVIVNLKIKEIFKKIGLDRQVVERRDGKDEVHPLYEVVTSHTFRRSFATNLYLVGVPIETISRMMGHTNTQQTLRYIQVNILRLNNDDLEFFK